MDINPETASPELDWIFDFEDWTLATHLAWWDLDLDIEDRKHFTAQIDEASSLMSRCIRRWPLPGDPSIETAYLYLGLEDWLTAFLAVGAAIEGYWYLICMSLMAHEEGEEPNG